MKSVNSTDLAADPVPVPAVLPGLVAVHVVDLVPGAASPTVDQRVGVTVNHVPVVDHLLLLRSRKAAPLHHPSHQCRRSMHDPVLGPGLVPGQSLVPGPDHLPLRVLTKC